MLSFQWSVLLNLHHRAFKTMALKSVFLAVILALSVGTTFVESSTTTSTASPAAGFTTEILPTNSTIAFISTRTQSPNDVKGAYFPPTDLQANITSNRTVFVTWKRPPKDKSPPKPLFQIWLAYRNAKNIKVSNFTKIDSTTSNFGKYIPKKLLHDILNDDRLEQRVVYLVFKVRTVSSDAEDKTVGKFSKTVDLLLKKPKPKVNAEPYLAPMNLSAKISPNGTVRVTWKSPPNGQPPEKPLYDIQIAYGTHPSVAPSPFKDLERGTTTYIESDIGKLLRRFVEDDEDKLVSYLLFRVRAIKVVAKKVINGKFSVFLKVKIRASQPRNFTQPKNTKTWIYVVAPLGGVIVALIIILGVYCHKQYRIRKSYMSYIRTQYDTESEALSVSNENFGLDSDNQPQIRFSDGEGDDESLIVA
ncbi:uncharacterized protein LOC135502135 [Lineus longissimus]|uniref:uncharacterized protein LOC135502135 n=1 Tax=Lineus longissimus TaxID=88925 RepID=UPI002B4C62E7